MTDEMLMLLAKMLAHPDIKRMQEEWRPQHEGITSGRIKPWLPEGATEMGDFSKAPGHALWGARIGRSSSSFSEAAEKVATETDNINKNNWVNNFIKELLLDESTYGFR